MNATDKTSTYLGVPPVLAQAVTAHRPFSMGGAELFAVQAGVPLSDALDSLSLLIGAAGAAVSNGAINTGEADTTDAAWAAAHLLDAAYALTSSIHLGLNQAQGTAPKTVQAPQL